MHVNYMHCLSPSPTERAKNGVDVGIHHLPGYRSFVKNLFSVSKAVPNNGICSSESHMADGRKEYTVNAAGL